MVTLNNLADLYSKYKINEADIIPTNVLEYDSVNASTIRQPEPPKRTAAGLYLNNKNEVIW